MITLTNGLTATQELKDQLNDLMMDVFGFSFDKWHSLNVWNQDYECYSIIEEGRMVANVSVYKLQLLIKGKQREFMQIGAVATRKDYQGKGLSRNLLEHIFTVYPNTPSFLFANDGVLNYYPKFGFVPITDQQPFIKYSLQKKSEMVKLDVTNPKVDQYLRERSQFSKIFDCANQYAINWFHIINSYYDHIYEIPQLEAMIVAKKFDETLAIYDVVAKNTIAFTDLIHHLNFEGVNTLSFGFNPDWMDFDYSTRPYKLEDTTLFIKGDFDIDEGYILPRLIRT